jgi:hypothetical protein
MVEVGGSSPPAPILFMEKEKAILLKINGELKEIGTPSVPGASVEEIYPHSPEARIVSRDAGRHRPGRGKRFLL